MTAQAAKFILALELGFLNRWKLEELAKLHPFCKILVRCNMGRFVCSAQDAAHFIAIVDASKDYVRDVAVTSEDIDEARRTPQPLPAPIKVEFKPRALQLPPHFNEADCGGVFDGFSVTSDADPGL